MMTGYLHPLYVESLAEFGKPLLLPGCGGWVLQRQVPGSPYEDAMGCYPLFACRDWPRIGADLAELEGRLVSLSLVTDPFGEYTEEQLHQCFDVVHRFKEHLLTRLDQPLEECCSAHHRYYARRCLRAARVECATSPLMHLDEWCALYQNLVERHGLRGIKAFSRRSFARQMAVPGMVMFRMIQGGECVGAQLWYVQGDVAYNHLAATSDRGYTIRASYGLHWEALRWFREDVASCVRWLDLGAGAGIGGEEQDGLAQFKRGWSNDARPVFFCGRILNRQAYSEIVAANSAAAVSYFPAYRAGELAP